MYSAIEHNKRKSAILITIFIVILLGLGYLLGWRFGNPDLGIILAVIVSTILSLVSYFKGDQVALSASRAFQIHKRDNPVLYDTVENIAITAGLPTPKVYLINDEAPNAFATGRDPEHASIAVTTGLLRILDKTELQGVIAHELSHIKNYDVRVMTITVVLVGGIMLLSDWLLRSFLFGDRKVEKNGQFALLLFGIGFVLAMLSPLIAQLIKMSLSRSREYMADASGALLTRYPEGLASALEKIAALDRPMKKPNHATAHLFLANPFDPHVTKRFEALFSTHPPIHERIARLRAMGA